TMIDYGIPNGDTSMARTVSLPAAIGVRMILEGKITVKGVHMPILPDIYNPILQELETLDIKVVERFYQKN
ncbi:MAG: saccharopine dehydrogenase, partial [Candidatus Cloacimonetes bacterium]|nr:saccharopine dehydrogenase [Candidatus Cloacimonadota bacterium]